MKLPDEGTAAKDAFQDSESFSPDEVTDGSEVSMPGARDTLPVSPTLPNGDTPPVSPTLPNADTLPVSPTLLEEDTVSPTLPEGGKLSPAFSTHLPPVSTPLLHDSGSQLKLLRERIMVKPRIKVRGRLKHSSKLWPSKKRKASKPNKENQPPAQSQSWQEKKRGKVINLWLMHHLINFTKVITAQRDVLKSVTRKFTFRVLLHTEPDCDTKKGKWAIRIHGD